MNYLHLEIKGLIDFIFLIFLMLVHSTV